MGGFANNAPIVTDGLVFYVDAGNSKSYPGSGATVSDLINGESLTMDSGAAISGFLIDFDGADDTCNYTSNSVPTNLQFEFSDSFTYSSWIKPNFSDTDGFGIAIGPIESGGNFKACAIINGPANQRLKPRFWLRDTSTQYELLTSTSFSMNQSQVYNVVFTYSGSRAASSWKMYIDGVDTAITRTNSGSATSLSYTGATLCIGNREATDAFWNGGIGPSSVYNRALSSAEVLQNYNALKNRFV